MATIVMPIWLWCNSAIAEPRKAMACSDLLDMIGINTHMIYNDGAYADVAKVIENLKFLGVHYIRDVLPGADSIPARVGREALRRMAYDGIKLNLFFPSGWNAQSIAWLLSVEGATPGAISSLEGYNEINNFPVKYQGLSGPEAAKQGQRAIYDTLKSDSILGRIRIIDMTGFEMIRDPAFSYAATLSGFADAMNVHAYSQNGAQPRYWINPERPEPYARLDAELPKVITEFGYSSLPQSGWEIIGVDEPTQAKGILNGIFDAARAGYDKLYIYELLDEKADPEKKELEFHFGLFTSSHEPKLAATAIRNLTSVLGDSGGIRSHTPEGPASNGAIDVDAESSDSENAVYSVALTKGNRSQLLAIWREPAFWDRDKGRALEAGSIQVKIGFGRTCRSIRLYDVLVSAEPISVSSGRSVAVALGDHVQLVECEI
jgi:hypothetical protein